MTCDFVSRLTGDELYLYGMGAGAALVKDCHAALAARAVALAAAGAAAGAAHANAAAAAPAGDDAAEALRRMMREQPGTWHAVTLGGEVGVTSFESGEFAISKL